MPFMDPAFAVAICRYDLSGGPIKLTVPVSQAYTSVSFYTRNEVAYYAINDRSAGRKVIELDLMTEEQHAELPEDEEVTAADRLIIDSPTATGLIVLKALAPEPGLMPQAQASLAASSCTVQTEPPPAKNPNRPPRAGPCARAEGQALKTACRADARSHGAKKRCATKAGMPNCALGRRKQRGNRCLPSIWHWAFSNIETGQMRLKIGAVPLVSCGIFAGELRCFNAARDEPPLQIPALKAGYGRVYFTRPGEFAGSARSARDPDEQ